MVKERIPSTLVFRNELEQIHACTLDLRLANFLLSNVSDSGVLHMTQQALAGHLGRCAK
jgi:CRP/FNR family transcriptional regulator